MRYTTLLPLVGILWIAPARSVGPPPHSEPERPPDIAGPARVIDGDTVEIADVSIRLEGIDAPEAGQRCQRAWLPGTWRCGRSATRRLKSLTAGTSVRCWSRGNDSYGRMLGVCFANGHDINARMVRDGLAWAFTKYSDSYVPEEDRARRAKRGIWRSETQTAWDYRASKWQVSQQQAPEGCAIKGNISPNGRIYHMPWSPWYERVRIDEADGERWFCSEADAKSSGWRPVGAS